MHLKMVTSVSDTDRENLEVMLKAVGSGVSARDFELMQKIAKQGISLAPLISNPFKEQQNPGINLPSEVTDKISYNAWTGLSRIICEGWIQNKKWLMSQTNGYDIGTFKTLEQVRKLLDQGGL